MCGIVKLMRLSINREEILKVISLFSTISRTGGILNMNSSIINLNAAGNVLHVSANTRFYVLKVRVDCTTESDGEFNADVNLLNGVLRSTEKKSTITLDKDQNSLVIYTGRSRSKITQSEVQEEESMTFGNVVGGFQTNTGTLKKVIDRTKHAISTSKVKPSFSCLYIKHDEGGKLTAYATDGFRLTKNSIPLTGDMQKTFSTFIDRDIVNCITTMLSHFEDEDVVVQEYDNNTGIGVNIGNNINMLLPTVRTEEVVGLHSFDNSEYPINIDVSRDEVKTFIDSCSMFSDKFKTLNFSIVSRDGVSFLRLFFENEFGSASKQIKILSDNPPTDIDTLPRLSYEYVRDAVNSVYGDTLNVSINTLTTPTRPHFRFMGENTLGDYSEVVSPLRDVEIQT